jgi:O-antigen/teichoic acid export membrane protein
MLVLLLKFSGLIFNLILTVLLVRILPAEKYAEFAVMFSVTSVGANFFSFGFPQSLATKIANASDGGQIESTIETALMFFGLNILVLSVLAVIFKLVISYTHFPFLVSLSISEITGVFFVIWCLVVEKTIADIFRGGGHPKLYTLCGGSVSILIAVGLIIIATGLKMNSPLIAILIIGLSSLLTATALLLRFLYVSKLRVNKPFQLQNCNWIYRIMKQSRSNWIIDSIHWIRSQSDLWIVAAIFDAESVKNYSLGLRVAFVAIVPATTLSMAASSKYSLSQNSREKVAKAVGGARNLGFAISMVSLAALFVIGDKLFYFLIKSSEGGASTVAAVLSTALVVCGLLGSGNQLLQINLYSNDLQRCVWFSLLLHVPLGVLAALNYGVRGILFETALLYLFQNILVAIVVYRRIGINLFAVNQIAKLT